MDCRPASLQDYLYGFLDEPEELRVRGHLDACARCRADLERLVAEKDVLTRAAALPSRARARRSAAATFVPLGFAAALLLLVLSQLLPTRGPDTEPALAAPGAQEKKPRKEAPADEAALAAQIAKIETALEVVEDEKERGRLKASLEDLRLRLDASKKEKPEVAVKKTPEKVKVDPNLERATKLKTELGDVYGKIKMSKDPDEKAKLEMRAQELNMELKLLSQGDKPEVDIKAAEIRLKENPDDAEALVLRASWNLDRGVSGPALKDLNRAIELKPDHAPAHLKRAIARAMMGDKDGAWADAKRGEELDRKNGKMIDETLGAVKKLTAPKEKKSGPKDVSQSIGGLQERLEELQAMAANKELSEAERERARRDAARVQAEIERLKTELKGLPPEPELKIKK